MTPEQKALRQRARKLGKKAALYLRYALYPVYDGDFETHIRSAVGYARQAWRTAIVSEGMKEDPR